MQTVYRKFALIAGKDLSVRLLRMLARPIKIYRMNKSDSKFPFKQLGGSLKKMRVQRQETLAEVSGAVEIDAELLSAYESGTQRPSEEILMLLMSHFSLKEEEADKLWDMAGYSRDRVADTAPASDDGSDRPPVIVMPMDVRIVYTDMVHLTANDFGVVMNFMQTGGPSGKPLAISRIGMSREHAKSVLELLQKTLAQSEPKQLPPPNPAAKTRKPKSSNP